MFIMCHIRQIQTLDINRTIHKELLVGVNYTLLEEIREIKVFLKAVTCNGKRLRCVEDDVRCREELNQVSLGVFTLQSFGTFDMKYLHSSVCCRT